MKTKHTLIDVSKLKTIKRDEGGGEGGCVDVVVAAVGVAMAVVRRWWGDDVVVVVMMRWWGVRRGGGVRIEWSGSGDRLEMAWMMMTATVDGRRGFRG
ncbi:hypothetical protein Tco_0499919 [Tanacetum coccineum]